MFVESSGEGAGSFEMYGPGAWGGAAADFGVSRDIHLIWDLSTSLGGVF